MTYLNGQRITITIHVESSQRDPCRRSSPSDPVAGDRKLLEARTSEGSVQVRDGRSADRAIAVTVGIISGNVKLET